MCQNTTNYITYFTYVMAMHMLETDMATNLHICVIHFDKNICKIYINVPHMKSLASIKYPWTLYTYLENCISCY